MRNGLFWLLVGPTLLLAAAAAYAALLLFALLLRRERRVLSFVEQVAERVNDGSRVGRTLWGLAMIVALLVLAAVLVNIKPLAPLALADVLLLLFLLGLASAAAARFVERWLAVPFTPDESIGAWPSNGWRTLALAAIFPVAGWLCALSCIAAALGAMGEIMVGRMRWHR